MDVGSTQRREVVQEIWTFPLPHLEICMYLLRIYCPVTIVVHHSIPDCYVRGREKEVTKREAIMAEIARSERIAAVRGGEAESRRHRWSH
jgi:hypothetical protein